MVNSRFPRGEAHIIDTPYLDRLSQQLFAEQKQRQIMRQQRQQAMDDEFAKNVANVRDADVDDITNAYGEWKLMNQELMKKKGGINPQDQLALLRSKANVMKSINASAAERKREDEMAKAMMNKPEDYEDDAYELMIKKRRLPISVGFQETIKTPEGTETIRDLADLNTYKYKGTDFDFQKTQKEAEGQLKDILGEETLTPDGFTYTTPVTQFGNTPAQYKESLLGSMALRKAGDAAERLWSKIPKETVAEIDRLYREIPKDKLKKMGLNEFQDLKVNNPENAAEQYATHMAKLYAINSEPKEGKPVTRRNEPAYLKAQLDKEKEMAALRHGYAVALKKTPGAKPIGDNEDESLYLEDAYDLAVDEAFKKMNYASGALQNDEVPMELNPVFMKAFAKQGIEPESAYVKKDGTIRPMYYQYNADGTKTAIPGLSKPMTRVNALLNLGVKATTGGQRYKEGKSAVENTKNQKPKTYKGLDKDGNPIFE